MEIPQVNHDLNVELPMEVTQKNELPMEVTHKTDLKLEQLRADPALNALIASITGIPVSNCWKIYDAKPDQNLYLIHYENNSNMNEYGHIRGIIVDVQNKLVVCNAYKYTPIVQLDSINFDIYGKLEMVDTLGGVHIAQKNKIKAVPGFEVVTIRVFKHNYNVYDTTYRKIDIWNSGSKWGDSEPFDKMALDLKIPSKEVLFPDQTKKYSNYVHIFMLVHQGILNVTKADIKDGFIVYAGTKTIWNVEDTQFNRDEVDTTPVKLEVTNDLEIAKTKLMLYQPPDFTIDQANNFLKKGYYSANIHNNAYPGDERLNNGEFMIMYTNNHSDPFTDVIRIEPSGYHWRSLMKCDHPNIKYRFFQLLSSANDDTTDLDNLRKFINKFPLMDKYSVDSIIKKLENGYIHFWPSSPVTPSVLTKEDRIYNIWACFIMSVPLHKQKQAAGLYYEYTKNKDETANMLYNIYISENFDNINTEDVISLNPRAIKLIHLAKDYALRYLNSNKIIVTDKSSLTSLNEQIKNNLKYLINNEEGGSLYRIYRDCQAYIINNDDKAVNNNDKVINNK